MSALGLGSIVQVHGLQNKTFYNGSLGKVKSEIPEDGRILIELLGGGSAHQSIKVKPENLKLVEAGPDDSEDCPDLIASSDEDEAICKGGMSAAQQVNGGKPQDDSRRQPQDSKGLNRNGFKVTEQGKKQSRAGKFYTDGSDESPDGIIDTSEEESTPRKLPQVVRNHSVANSNRPSLQELIGDHSAVISAPGKLTTSAKGQGPAVPSAASSKSRDVEEFVKNKMIEGQKSFSAHDFGNSLEYFQAAREKLESSFNSDQVSSVASLANAETWVARSLLQLGRAKDAYLTSESALVHWKMLGSRSDHNDFMQALLCRALAVKAIGAHSDAYQHLMECDRLLKDDTDSEIRGRVASARQSCTEYVSLRRGPMVILKRSEKTENRNRKGWLMELDDGKRLFVELDNGSDQVVNPGDYEMISPDTTAADGSPEPKISPPTSELKDVLREMKKSGFGAKKMLADLRDSHPHWEVSEKRIKKCLKELESGGDEASGELAGEFSVVGSDSKLRTCPRANEGDVKFLPKLVSVRQYVIRHLECTTCLEEMFTLTPDGAHHHEPMILKLCGHTLCDVCCADLDARRQAAFEKHEADGKRPDWPKCPSCQVELKAKSKAEANESVAVKNYLACDMIDILYNRARPRET